jgi:Tol biopolymer transport system component
MRFIIIILLIIFLAITSLLGVTMISMGKDAETPGIDEEVQEVNSGDKKYIPDSRVETIDDPQKFFITNPNLIAENTGIVSAENIDEEQETHDNNNDSNPASTETRDTEAVDNTQLSESQNECGEQDESEKEKDDENGIESGTMQFFLDGDMENGIYLGETIPDLESMESSQLYGEDFINTGFKFNITNDSNLSLASGSTHYVYIYFLTEDSEWEYIREEINLPGEEGCEKKITIFVEKPVDKTTIPDFQSIKGWSVDLRDKENPGIKNIEIYLDGPKGYGKSIGNAEYGISREDVAGYFENINYQNSGYYYEKLIDLEPGSAHTIFIYAFSSTDNLFNYETRDIYISGTKEEKAVIKTQINTQKFRENNIIEITGFAIDKSILEQYLKEKEQAEKESLEINGQYDTKKIIFNSNRGGNENIYSINIDGTDLARLTTSNGNDMYPEVSPDGSKIAYTSDIGGVWQIMVMDWNGENKKQITRGNYRCAYPSWSYDGKYIYFELYSDGDWEIYRINSDGTGQKRLTFNNSSHDWHPTGHPYEYKIIYESGTTGHENIYIINHDGSGKRKICGDEARRRVPDVSPDGSKITYMRYSGSNCDIWIMDYNGKNETRLTSNPDEDGHPSFSPDGGYIIYEERKGSREDLILINIITGEKTNLTNSPYIDKDGSFLYR